MTLRGEPSGVRPRMLSAYDSEGRELPILAQWQSTLAVRILKGERVCHLRYREIGVKVLPRGETRSIAITSDNAGLRFYADGILLKTVPPSIISYLSCRRPARGSSSAILPPAEAPGTEISTPSPCSGRHSRKASSAPARTARCFDIASPSEAEQRAYVLTNILGAWIGALMFRTPHPIVYR